MAANATARARSRAGHAPDLGPAAPGVRHCGGADAVAPRSRGTGLRPRRRRRSGPARRAARAGTAAPRCARRPRPPRSRRRRRPRPPGPGAPWRSGDRTARSAATRRRRSRSPSTEEWRYSRTVAVRGCGPRSAHSTRNSAPLRARAWGTTGWAEADEKAARALRWESRAGPTGDEIRQGGDREPRQEQPVPDGVRSHLLGDERGRRERCCEVLPSFAHPVGWPKGGAGTALTSLTASLRPLIGAPGWVHHDRW